MEIIFIIMGIFSLIVIFAFFTWKAIKTKRAKIFAEIKKNLEKIHTLPSSQKILEYDKLLDKALFALGYTGTTGEKMKRHGKNFGDQNNIWFAHKLRNRIAHEIGFVPTETEVQKAEKIFVEEIQKISKRLL